MAKVKVSTAKRAVRGPSAADVARLGVDTASIKSSMNPKDWASAVRAAHSKGYTISSALSDTPDPLKQRTKSSLLAQAQKTVQDAYQPQKAELDYAATQAAGLRAKRLSDEDAFNSWYAQQVSQSNARADAAQQKYQDYMTGLAAKREVDAANRQAELTAASQQGASGDVSQSTYLKAAAERAGVQTQAVQNSAAAAVESGRVNAAQRQADTSNIAGRHAGAQGLIEGDYGKVLNEVTAGKLKLASSQAQDQIKSYTDLLNQELTKANAVQQNAGLMATLTEKQQARKSNTAQFYAGLKAKTQTAAAQRAVTKRGQDVAATTQRQGQTLSHDDRVADRLSRETQKTLDRANALKVAAQRTGAGSVAAGAASKKGIQAIHSIAGIIKTERNGMIMDPKTGHYHSTRSVLRGMGASDDQINVALRVVRGARGAQAIHNPELLGILPSDVGLI